SHDNARLFWAAAIQPHAALHGFRRDLLHGVQPARGLDLAALSGALRRLHASEYRLFAHGAVCLFHDGDVRLDVLHRAAVGRARMALRFAHQTPFLVVDLWRWFDGADVARGGDCTRQRAE